MTTTLLFNELNLPIILPPNFYNVTLHLRVRSQASYMWKGSDISIKTTNKLESIPFVGGFSIMILFGVY